jgi:hypothetical protein
MIIDGKIKVKNDSHIKQFTSTGLEFEDGSALPADVVIYATGLALRYFPERSLLTSCTHARFGDAKKPIREICGEEIASRMKLKWGLDSVGIATSLHCARN